MRLNPRHLVDGTLPRDTRDTLFLLCVIGWIVLLKVPQLPGWCSALSAATLVWRGTLAVHNRPLPRWPWRLLLLVSAMAGVWATHRTLIGQEAGVTFLVLLLALKTLELRARRDAFVVFFLGFFTLLTQFFHSQSLLTALGILLALLGLLTALVNAHMPLGRPPLAQSARLAATLALWGSPFMVALFLLFPRLGPLWSIPQSGLAGTSGLSSLMEVGQIAQLALDPSIAFRVTFGGPRPPQNNLYFRGPVLSDFDGRTWRPATLPLPNASNAQLTWMRTTAVSGTPVRYSITLEPHRQNWLLTLDATLQTPVLANVARAVPGMALQWTSNRPVTEITRYDAVAHTRYQLGLQDEAPLLLQALALPTGLNPRTQTLAHTLRQNAGPNAEPSQLIDAALQHLRQGGYRYTLAPGVFGTHGADEFWFDRRAGFCEHIASSFAVLSRAMGIPTRVVTGYQGGQTHPVDGLWTVRQSDAHAWVEVWLPHQGWTRVDPTTHVMPERTQGLERLRPAPGWVAGAVSRFDPSLLMRMRTLWEATNHRWDQWVLNYTQSQQLNMLKHLGIDSPDWTDLLAALGGLTMLSALAVSLWLWRERTRIDPWLRLLGTCRQRLQSCGIALPPQATPRQMRAALQAHGTATQALQDWLLALEAARYNPQAETKLQTLKSRLKTLPWPKRQPTRP